MDGSKYKYTSHVFFAIIFILSAIAVDNTQVYSQQIFFSADHWVHDYVERLENEGIIGRSFSGTRPFSRLDVAKIVYHILSNRTLAEQLTNVEREQTDYLVNELKEELQSLGLRGMKSSYQIRKGFFKVIPDMFYRNNRNFLNVEKNIDGTMFRMNIDPVIYRDLTAAEIDSGSGNEKTYSYSNGIRIWGTVGNSFGYAVNARDSKEWGDKTYPVLKETTYPGLGWVSGYGTHIYHDEVDAYVTGKKKFLSVFIGKGKNAWGPGRSGQLLLSSAPTSYDQIRIRADIWKFRFTSIAGFLESFPRIIERQYLIEETGRERILYAKKYIAAHRLEISLRRNLSLGLHESVIYGERGLEIAYLNPVMFYWSAEHYLGDQDNSLIGWDVQYSPVRNLKLYWEFLLDDFSVSRINTDWMGNKYAYLIGLFCTNILSVNDLDFRLEYTKTRPYVYTHFYPVNVYKHFNTGLGHSIGPNADQIFVNILYRYSRRISSHIQMEYYRHGASTEELNVGGDMNRTISEGDPRYIGFLEGIVEKQFHLKLEFSYEVFRETYMKFRYEYLDAKNNILGNGENGDFSGNTIFLSGGINF